ncbi:MAG: MmcQ/YjbR family DNA-binding protein [Clostridia bacterium]|nr:MmcQ/YjbR family DNA-binding protein [Clostridia bacterium]
MNRKEFDRYIRESYGIDREYTFGGTDTAVYRHPSNRKWFAIVMYIPKRYLGIGGEEHTDVVNLKCDPTIIPDLIAEGFVYPAYHMNKTHWISVPLDGSRDGNTVKWLLDISYKLTDKRKK